MKKIYLKQAEKRVYLVLVISSIDPENEAEQEKYEDENQKINLDPVIGRTDDDYLDKTASYMGTPADEIPRSDGQAPEELATPFDEEDDDGDDEISNLENNENTINEKADISRESKKQSKTP